MNVKWKCVRFSPQIEVFPFTIVTFVRLMLSSLVFTTNAFGQEYRLPFKGRWFVYQGGDTVNVNHHMEEHPQWYGIDFAKVGGQDGRSLFKGDGTKLADFYSWSETVLSPVAGEVKDVVDGFPDNPIGVRDENHPGGNQVIIAAATNRYAFISHLQKGSLKVKRGQRVTVGQELGKCGNSGNSDAPHIHMHVQDSLKAGEGTGQNVIFKSINVELTGKKWEGVDWPMIRGLFVSSAE
jgi:murein DD-endopeptidase MepM/ murein hydrolase activator NlpD